MMILKHGYDYIKGMAMPIERGRFTLEEEKIMMIMSKSIELTNHLGLMISSVT